MYLGMFTRVLYDVQCDKNGTYANVLKKIIFLSRVF